MSLITTSLVCTSVRRHGLSALGYSRLLSRTPFSYSLGFAKSSRSLPVTPSSFIDWNTLIKGDLSSVTW